MNSCRQRLSVLIFLLAICSSKFVSAHPFHTTVAEMEFNPATGRFEVALKIHASDFEQMIRSGQHALDEKSLAGKTAPSISSVKELRKTQKDGSTQNIAHYLEKSFAVSLEGKPCRFEWVGMEDEQASKWLYFELVLPEGSTNAKAALTNKVLCDTNLGQINTVVFIGKSARVSLKTHEHHTTIALPSLD